MKKLSLFLTLLMASFCIQAFSQNVSNDPSFLKHRTYKIYFGQNYLSSIYVDKTQLSNIIGAGPYKFYWNFGDGDNQVSSSEENILVQGIKAYNPVTIGEIPNVPNNTNTPVSCSALYGSFDTSSDPKLSIVFNRRDGTFNDYINVVVMSTTSGRYCTGAIAQVLTGYLSSNLLKDINGMTLNFDLDRTNVTSGHTNINGVGYNYDGKNVPTFVPAASQIAGNHVFLQNFSGSSIAESNTIASGTTSTTIAMSSNVSSTVTYSGCKNCSVTNINADGTVDIKITGLQGGGGRYEVFVPNTGEYITFPMTKSVDCVPTKQVVSFPYYVYYAQNSDETSLSVKLKPNQSNEVRVRSAFDYDNAIGNNWIENGETGHFAWDSDPSFLNKVANTGYTSFYITPITGTTSTTDSTTNTSGGTTNTSGGTTNTSGGTTNTSGGTTNTSGGTTNTSGGTTNTSGGTTNTSGSTTNTSGGATNTSGGATNTSGGTTNTSGGTTNTSGGTTNTSGGTTNTSGGTTNTSGGTTNTSGGATNTSGGATNTSGGTTNTSGGTTNTSGGTTNTSGSTTNTSGSTTNTSGSTTNTSGGTTNTSGGTTNTSGGTTNTSGGTTNTSGGTTNTSGGTTNTSGGTTTPICPSDGVVIGVWNMTSYQLMAKTVNGQLWLALKLPTNNKAILPEVYGATDAFMVMGRNTLTRTDVTLSSSYDIKTLPNCFAGGDTAADGIIAPSAASPFVPALSGYNFISLSQYQMSCYRTK